jgi:hypothetical protein
MQPSYEAVAAKIDEIEAEMRRIGLWQDERPPEADAPITKAFGADVMAFPLEQAKSLLERTDSPLDLIAALCGFRNRGFFTRAFSAISAAVTRLWGKHPPRHVIAAFTVA